MHPSAKGEQKLGLVLGPAIFGDAPAAHPLPARPTLFPIHAGAVRTSPF